MALLHAELHVSKESFKFSAAHFIVHAEARERLHGHNYRVAVAVRGTLYAGGSDYLVDFAAVKAAARDVCAALDERFLCPTRNPHLAVAADAREVALTVRRDGARFLFPAADVVLLPVRNVTVETLAGELAGRLVQHPALAPHIGREIGQLTVGVTETAGQEARITYDAAKLLAELAAGAAAPEAVAAAPALAALPLPAEGTTAGLQAGPRAVRTIAGGS